MGPSNTTPKGLTIEMAERAAFSFVSFRSYRYKDVMAASPIRRHPAIQVAGWTSKHNFGRLRTRCGTYGCVRILARLPWTHFSKIHFRRFEESRNNCFRFLESKVNGTSKETGAGQGGEERDEYLAQSLLACRQKPRWHVIKAKPGHRDWQGD